MCVFLVFSAVLGYAVFEWFQLYKVAADERLNQLNELRAEVEQLRVNVGPTPQPASRLEVKAFNFYYGDSDRFPGWGARMDCDTVKNYGE
jgi:hypothetical protein